MKFSIRSLLTGAALAALLSAAASLAPAFAQEGTNPDADDYVPPYTTWQPAWSQYRYDRHHVILGMVTNFSPYRLTIQHRNGMVQTIDLKPGTMIYPTGATPTQGERVAVVGYYSNGTFIANRVVIRA